MCLRLQNLPTLTQLYMDMTRTYHPSTYYTYVRQEIKFKKKNGKMGEETTTSKLPNIT